MTSSQNRVMRARLARALRLAPTLLAVCPAALAAQTIDTILVVRHNVYDRKRDAPKVVASVGNALHITTLAWVVRHALLIKRGDSYDSAKVAESERALRALTIFRAVSIGTERVDGGRLALRVETDDAWSTIPDFDYSSVAGDVLWAVAFTEGNLLGSGTALTGRYEKTPDRHSVSVGYSSTGLLGRRTALTGQYKAISDCWRRDRVEAGALSGARELQCLRPPGRRGPLADPAARGLGGAARLGLQARQCGRGCRSERPALHHLAQRVRRAARSGGRCLHRRGRGLGARLRQH